MKQFIKIRDHVESDHPFLYATYLKNNWYDKTNTTTLKKATWMGLQHSRLEKVLNNQKVKIACLEEDPDIILGYGFQDGAAPFVYVKLAWRQNKLNLKELLLNSIQGETNEQR